MKKINRSGAAPEATPSPWRYLPNVLSVLRIVLIPVIIFFSLIHEHLWALIVFGIGALTDLFDGLLARRYGWQTPLGSLLDPVADKLFVLCLIPLLWHLDAIGPVFTVLIVARYLLQLSVFPVLMGWLKRPFKVAPQTIPKLATAVAFLVLGMGFADQVAIEVLDESTGQDEVFDHTLAALTLIGCLLEIWVLVTFVPRYLQIIRGTHDTFE